MINNKAVLLFINGDGIDYVNYEDIETKWLEVFYFLQIPKTEKMPFMALCMAHR